VAFLATRGFGPSASIAGIVVRAFGIGAAVVEQPSAGGRIVGGMFSRKKWRTLRKEREERKERLVAKTRPSMVEIPSQRRNLEAINHARQIAETVREAIAEANRQIVVDDAEVMPYLTYREDLTDMAYRLEPIVNLLIDFLDRPVTETSPFTADLSWRPFKPEPWDLQPYTKPPELQIDPAIIDGVTGVTPWRHTNFWQT
jgi:hypothetical protein